MISATSDRRVRHRRRVGVLELKRELLSLAASRSESVPGIGQTVSKVRARSRHEGGGVGGVLRVMQGKLADMYTTMNASKAYVYAVAQACDRGQTTRKDAAGAILYASEKATWMALEAIQSLGASGYINEFPTGRLLRDAKLYEIGAGTSEIRRMLIGRELFEETA